MTQSATPRNIIFYADDDQDDLELVQDAFSRFSSNVEVITARDGSRALQWLQGIGKDDPKPCLIILDINMPVFNGKEVLKKIRTIEHLEDIPVVLFTTSSMPQDQHFAQQHNAGFVTKPLDVSQMEKICEQFINHCPDSIRQEIRGKNSRR